MQRQVTQHNNVSQMHWFETTGGTISNRYPDRSTFVHANCVGSDRASILSVCARVLKSRLRCMLADQITVGLFIGGILVP